MSTFEKVRDITVEQLSVDADEVKMESSFMMIWALTPSTSLN